MKEDNHTGGKMNEEASVTDLKKLTAAIQSLERTIKGLPSMSMKVPSSNLADSPLRRLSNVGMGSLEDEASYPDSSDTVKRKVFIRVVFMKIGEIDTIHEKYAADVYIHGKWREPKLDYVTNIKTEEIKWSQYWSPKLFIANYLGDGKEEKWRAISFDSQGLATVCAKQRVTGSFLEYLELRQFPFDTQDLTITVSSNLGEHEVEFVEDDEELCGVNRESFVDMQEWHLHSSVHTWLKPATKVFQSSKHKHPAISVACKASRRPGFFIWNVILLMLVICSLSFAVFAVNVHLIPNRLQLSFILLLTTVTFKFVVTHNLPKISYTTYLDKYILSSMIFLCCVTVWHVIVSLLEKREDHSGNAEFADSVAFYVLISLWICFQVFFFIWVAVISYYNKTYVMSKLKRERKRKAEINVNLESSIMEKNSIPTAKSNLLHRNRVTAKSSENKVLPELKEDRIKEEKLILEEQGNAERKTSIHVVKL